MVYPMAQQMAKTGHLREDFPCDHWKLVAWRVSWRSSKRGMFGMMPKGGDLMVIIQKMRHISWWYHFIIFIEEYMMSLCSWFYIIYIIYQICCDICGMPLFIDEYVVVQFWLAQFMLCCVYYNLCSSWWGKKSSNHNLNSGKFREDYPS